ncbi:DNA-directed RNA polymerase II core subunit rpo21, partial [Coemansia sp. RSA 1591]
MAYNLQLTHSSAPMRRVQFVQFGIFSPEELRSMSVVKIESPDLRDDEGRPKLKGLLDPHLGTIDRNVKCHTCRESMFECPGHFGHIDLAKPVFHIGFIEKVKKVLSCVCWNCGKLKADFNDPAFQRIMKVPDPTMRAQLVLEHCKKHNVCDKPADDAEMADAGATNGVGNGYETKPGCGSRQPTFQKIGPKIIARFKAAAGEENPVERDEISAERAIQTLKKISDQDAEILGINPHYARPEWMVLSVMPVPPMTVRPSIQMDAMRPSEDDLTHKLNDIIKANLRLHQCM